MLALLARCDDILPNVVRFYDDDENAQALKDFQEEAQKDTDGRDLDGDDDSFEIDWTRLIRVQSGTLETCPNFAIATWHGDTQSVTVRLA